jgi:multidrug efflux system membrane fusion protein
VDTGRTVARRAAGARRSAAVPPEPLPTASPEGRLPMHDDAPPPAPPESLEAAPAPVPAAVADRVSPPPPRPGSRGGSWWSTIFWLALFGAAGGYAATHPEEARKLWARVAPPPAPAKPPAARIVPVNATAARRADLDLFLDGLGSVVALNSVTLKSRVDGELVNVAFTEGQLVAEGDLLAEIDPRAYEVQLSQAEGQLARDQAALDAAKLDLERYESLAGLKQVTGQQIDAQRALVRQCEAALQIDRGRIDDVRLQLGYCRITAPISGRIGLRLVDPGNMVRAAEAKGLAVIAQVHPIAVVFTIPQDEIFRVQRALEASGRLAVDAYNRDFRTKLAGGELLAIDNQVDPATGTVRLKAVFPNDDDRLFPNQFVNARLLVQTLREAVVIPQAAVQHGPKSQFVYVVQPDSTVALRTVETGAAQGDNVAVTGGVEAGDLVVTDGIDKLTDKTKVAVRGLPGKGAGEAAVAAGPPAPEAGRGSGR